MPIRQKFINLKVQKNKPVLHYKSYKFQNNNLDSY